MESILLPTDFSNNSINAIHYAIELYKDVRCEFFFLNVQKASSFMSDDLMTMEPSTTLYENLIETSKKNLEKIIVDVRKKFRIGKHIYHSVVDYDGFVDSINQIVKAKNISLIVMGTRGATGAEKVLFGSNTVRVIKRAKCTVLAIPDNYKFKKIERIALPSDYNYPFNMDELKPLVQLAEAYNSKVDVLHMSMEDHFSEEQENNRSYLDECFMKLNREFINLEKGNLFKMVEHYLLYNDIDLLAMMRRKHSFLERLFAKHHVETFAFKVSVPFLVLKNYSNH